MDRKHLVHDTCMVYFVAWYESWMLDFNDRNFPKLCISFPILALHFGEDFMKIGTNLAKLKVHENFHNNVNDFFFWFVKKTFKIKKKCLKLEYFFPQTGHKFFWVGGILSE